MGGGREEKDRKTKPCVKDWAGESQRIQIQTQIPCVLRAQAAKQRNEPQQDQERLGVLLSRVFFFWRPRPPPSRCVIVSLYAYNLCSASFPPAPPPWPRMHAGPRDEAARALRTKGTMKTSAWRRAQRIGMRSSLSPRLSPRNMQPSVPCVSSRCIQYTDLRTPLVPKHAMPTARLRGRPDDHAHVLSSS